MERGVSLIIFSDLDGTLLDHDSYSFRAAEPALTRLKRLKVPVILASSKTAPELEQLQQALGLRSYPAIVENGAGVLGIGANAPLQATYPDLRQRLDQIPQGLRAKFEGFGDMTTEQVAEVTGLSEAEAKRARTRQFSEPGLWHGTATEWQEAVTALQSMGIHAREGGRFRTLSFGSTKKSRMDEIAQRYAPAAIAALGDAPNDTEMLENADYGYIVANPHRSPLPPLAGEAEGRVRRTDLPGPAGWNKAVNDLLDDLNLA